MSLGIRHILYRTVLLALLTLAFVATGYGHRVATPADAAVTLALANGATAADFCGDLGTGGRSAGLHCPVCHITGAADLPRLDAPGVDLGLAIAGPVFLPRDSRAPLRVRDPAHRPQGPPLA